MFGETRSPLDFSATDFYRSGRKRFVEEERRNAPAECAARIHRIRPIRLSSARHFSSNRVSSFESE